MSPSTPKPGLKLAGILFLDVKSFSTLNQHQLEQYIQFVAPEIAKLIAPYRDTLIELNTWGDGLIVVSENPVVLAKLALGLRDYFRVTNFEEKSLPNSLKARISLHAGTVYFGYDPIRKMQGVIGANINVAARVEPVIVPGEVWATEEFAKIIDLHVSSEKLAFDELGEQQLAKNYGSRKLLRLRRLDEAKGLSSEIANAIRTETKLTELHTPFDLIGIGALNTDYTATATALGRLKPDLVRGHEQYFEFGKERPASDDEVRRVIGAIGNSLLTKSLGGLPSILCTLWPRLIQILS